MRFRRFAAVALCVGVFAGGVAGCGDDDDEGVVDTVTEQVGTVADEVEDALSGGDVSLTLQEVNGSGVSGEAILRADGERTIVTLDLEGAPATHPAHIHEGTCADLDPAPKFPLTDASNEETETTVEASLEAIQGQPHAINVHESAENLQNYVACVDIPTNGDTTTTGTTTTP